MLQAKTVTRADLVEMVSEKSRLPRSDAARIVARVFEVIEETLVHGEAVKLSRFGNFLVRSKRERVGRNPKTGLEVPITPRRVVTFRPSQLLKDKVEKGGKGKGKKGR